jgi:hypothetical protein
MQQRLEASSIIILSEELCQCERPKTKPHCPNCGRVKLYAYSDTTIAIQPKTGDFLINCKTFRCLGCGEKFNDAEWYFSCHAPKQIDWEATKKQRREAIKQDWYRRVATGEHFDFNTRQKCRAEAGFDPQDLKASITLAKMQAKSERKIDFESTKALKDTLNGMLEYLDYHKKNCKVCQMNEPCETLQDTLRDIAKTKEEIVNCTGD